MIEREKATKIEDDCACDTSLVCSCGCVNCCPAGTETASAQTVQREKGTG